ncbi:hypothetical protein [Streptomyces echinatus]|uniref:Uncharacterized protein n=1 Tax=Streptomyces echinatus TaxID=67293 RepID=A0A7W9PU14_9ACTN|nr:hypothetical protein [Streptomyces echinatus]MBB5927985.1 hypothetical protein [Streptomyces echinatus]
MQPLRQPRYGDSIYFWPLHTGQVIPIHQWRSRMWLDTWDQRVVRPRRVGRGPPRLKGTELTASPPC